MEQKLLLFEKFNLSILTIPISILIELNIKKVDCELTANKQRKMYT